MKHYTLSQTLKYISILIVLVIGAMYPPFWFLLLLLVIYEPKKVHTSSESYQSKSHTTTTIATANNPIHIINPSWISIVKKDYLASTQWKQKRKEVFKHYGYKCYSCGSTSNLEVHHEHYNTFTEESVHDLKPLCRSCHQLLHDRLGYDYSTDFSVTKLKV